VESLLYTSNNYNRNGLNYNSSGAFTAHNNNNLFYFTSHNYNNQKDDVVELFIDCDQRMIRVTNERTRHTQQLNINLPACLFPWLFFISLLYANDRVRLCEEKCVETIKIRN
jgi:hypothetical protein